MVRGISILTGLATIALGLGSASLAAAGATAKPAAAAVTPADVTETPLPVQPFYEPYMAVDPVGQHVFVAASEGTSSIYVLDFDGNLVKTITGEQGASGMAVDTATHTLYVADYDATAVAEIDTQTLTETARFSTAPFSGVFSLAIAGGKLWMATAANGSGTVAVANLDGSDITDAGIGDRLPNLLASSADGHLLAVGDHESEPPNVSVYDVSGDTPSLVSHVWNPGGNATSVDDITFDPSGSNVLLVAGSIHALSTSTLLSSASYPTSSFPTAVAVTADGNYVATGSSAIYNTYDLFVYPTGDTTPVASYAIGQGNNIMAHALAFSPDGSRLFALSRASNNDLALEVIDDPTLATTMTTLSAPEFVRYG